MPLNLPNKNATQGRKAGRSGNRAEAGVEGYCRFYAMQGAAFIDRQNVRTSGSPTARRIIGKAPIDFGGVIGGGRAIFAEVKSSGCKSGLQIDDRHLEPHQIEALAVRGGMGAVAVVLWLNGDTLGVADWRAVGKAARERSSVPRSAFTWLPVLSFDWLPVAIAVDRAAGCEVAQ